jgi:hypothetical protein
MQADVIHPCGIGMNAGVYSGTRVYAPGNSINNKNNIRGPSPGQGISRAILLFMEGGV